jgi:diguanylate cyclase (GGDEF)-like protein/PAS domain S-box-containing protein
MNAFLTRLARVLARPIRLVHDASDVIRDTTHLARLSHDLQMHQIELEAQNLELLAAQQHLLDARDRYQNLFDFAPVGYVTVNGHGKILDANMTLASYVGKPREHLVGLPFMCLLQPGQARLFLDTLQRALACTDRLEIELVLRDPQPTPRIFMLSLQAVARQARTLPSCRITLVDITARKQAENALRESRENLEREVADRTRELRITIDTLNLQIRERTAAQQSLAESQDRMSYLAHHDALTRLPNRVLFSTRLEQSLQVARRNQVHAAVLFLDLDRFKSINDTLGHAMGDELLCEVARRLGACVRSGDTVARLGGDEFTVIMSELRHEEEAALVAQKILELIAQPIRLGNATIVISTSIGIGMFPRDAATESALIRCADLAMYDAKASGRNSYSFYSEELTSRAEHKLTIEQNIRNGLQKSEFSLVYQPQMDVASGRMIGVEALLRWNNPDRGLTLPDQVIPVAEDTGLIVNVDEWSLRTAFEQFARWREAGVAPFVVSINCSGLNFLRTGYVDRVRRALKDFNVPAECFELELTESVFNRGPDTIRELEKLRGLGLKLAIDDFGTGFSSLSSLKHLPVDRIKIDRSFIQDLPHSNSDSGIAQAIIDMGHHLDMKVIAEGVESDEQLQFLRVAGCDEVQGYRFGRPLAPELIPEFLIASTVAVH